MSVTYCRLTRRARGGEYAHPDPKWHREVRVEYDWSDAAEEGTNRIWDAAVAEYRRLVPQCPPEQILEIDRY
jgi:hypothetical protein